VLDQRTLDRLVVTIADELEKRNLGGRAAGGSGPDTSVALVDNWRVRADYRQKFIDYYTTHVADVIKQLDGYRGGRVFSLPDQSSYSWHVQAYYEFDSLDVLARFRADYDKALRKIKVGLTMEKVLDAMDPWVLAHEDAVLREVWR
jgi:hypothetical protein